MIEEPKPAASLTAAKVRRGAPAVLAGPAPSGASALSNVSESSNVRQLVSSARDVAARSTPKSRFRVSMPESGGGLLTWRRAGLFGLVYVCALLFFAAAFDVWPLVLG